MSALLDWLASHESALSAVAAIIAIIAGVAVLVRLMWTRMPGKAIGNMKRPAFLADWRNVGLISLALLALLLMAVLALSPDSSRQNSDDLAVAGKPSVAVLPLKNISGDPEQAYLADGIAEDIITLLSRNPRFFVVARNSSFTYRDKAVDIRKVGKELRVRYVVEGSLRKIGGRLRVSIQLIDTTNGLNMWAEQYDRPFTEIFVLQDEITNGIAVALGDEIFSAEIARANSTSTNNLDAWGLMMRASQALISWNNESSASAVSLFRAALILEPDYALAKAELARSLCWRAVNNWGDNQVNDISEAYKLGAEALQAAPNDPLILFAVGSCYGGSGRPEEAIRLLKKAITKQPNFAMALGFLGASYAFDGQSLEGLPYSEKALQLAPQSPYIYLYETWRSFSLNELGRYEEAEQTLNNALQSYDGWWLTWLSVATAHAGQGDIKGAQEALYRANKREPLFSLDFVKGSTALVFKNKGKNILALLEPNWPEDLLTAESN